MRLNRFSAFALALACVFLSAAPIRAGGAVFRQHTVYRGGAWFPAHHGFVPGGSSEFFFTPRGSSEFFLSPRVSSEFFLTPGNSSEFFLSRNTGGSTDEALRTMIRSEFALQKRAESDLVSGIPGGGIVKPTVPAVSDNCAQMTTRVGKIEDRLSNIERDVAKIQTKVDQLYDADMQRRQAEADDMRTRVIIQGITRQLADQNKVQAQIMADLVIQLQIQPATPESKARIAELHKKLTQQ